ncbi:hypothetical protein D3C86_1864900 [compost metagenome]
MWRTFAFREVLDGHVTVNADIPRVKGDLDPIQDDHRTGVGVVELLTHAVREEQLRESSEFSRHDTEAADEIVEYFLAHVKLLN